MKSLRIISAAIAISLCTTSALAQAIFSFNVSQQIPQSLDDYFSIYLAEQNYKDIDSYYAQLLHNPYYTNLEPTADSKPLAFTVMNTSTPQRDNYFGLGTWATVAQFDNVRITAADGSTVVYSHDFSKPTDEWNQNGGSWTVADGVLRQDNAADLGSLCVCYQRTGHEATLELDATKISGAEGFLIAFSYIDNENYTWWNIGGWNNTQHAIEQCVDGVKTTLSTKVGSITTGQTYHLKIVMQGDKVNCYIDDILQHSITLTTPDLLYAGGTLNTSSGPTAMVRITNPGTLSQDVIVSIDGTDITTAQLLGKQISTAYFTPTRLETVNTQVSTTTDLGVILDGAVKCTVKPRSLSALKFTFNDDGTLTAIDRTDESDEAETRAGNTATYDLLGRRVTTNSPLPRGVYIIGGKKVFIR